MGGFGEGPQPEHEYRETFPGNTFDDLVTYLFPISVERIEREWHPGSHESSEKSFYKHYNKHHYEVGANNPDQYLDKAANFKVRAKRRGGRGTPVIGATPGVKRYRKDGKYVDVAPDGRIVSFGTTL
jgi:hypothetical protein